MTEKPAPIKPTADYQSTPEDKSRAWLLGVVYIVMAVLLAWLLFKIWPPTPWPTDKTVTENQWVADNTNACLCAGLSPSRSPSPPPSPSPTQAATTPTPAATPTATGTGGAGSQPTPPNSGRAPTPTATPTPTPSPSPKPTPADTQINIPIDFFWGAWRYCTSFDERLILLVIVAGMLGSFVHGATSLADYLGNNKFNKNWTWFYLLRPAIGMSLALVFYFVIRGGFLTTSGGAKDINPYGIAALAGMVGMFSKQATDKLSEVFSTLFRSAGDANRADPLKPDAVANAVTITGLDKDQVAAGTTDQTVVITGTNFVAGTKAFLNDVEQSATVDSPTQITAKLTGESIANVGDFKLKVQTPDNQEATFDFKVVAAEG